MKLFSFLKEQGVNMNRIKNLVFAIVLFGLTVNVNLFCGENETEGMASFFSTRVPELMEKYHIAGVTLSIIKDGKIAFSRGFGYGDVVGKVKVSPDSTLFRAGSISKLFVWTALMQLYERGLVDLDADINIYLGDYKIPDAFGIPITIKNLMSHTPGFEDKTLGLFTKDERRLQSLVDVIRKNRPKRIVPPGAQISYSNYGAMLGGFIVERVSGMSLEDYVEKNIFAPLGMNHSTFRQPIPKEMRNDLAKGYAYANGKYIEQGFEFVQGAPAGALSTTASDLSRFLIAHLQNGEFQGNRILKPGTAILMHTRHYSSAPPMNGFAHGFIEDDMNNVRIIGHGGDTIYYHSLALIIPDKKLGFFISTNAGTGGIVTIPLFMEFVNKFFPAPTGAELIKSISTARPDYTKYVGTYRVNRRDESDFLKALSLSMSIGVQLSKDKKAVEISDILTREVVRCVEVKPRVFQEEKGTKRYVFLADERGKIAGLMCDYAPIFTFLRAPFYEQMAFNASILIATLILLAIGLIAKPTGIVAFAAKKNKAQGLARLAGYAGSFLIITYIIFIISLFIVFSGDFIFSVPNPAVFACLYASIAASAIMVLFTIAAWVKKYWGRLSRIYYTLLTLDAIAFVWFAIYWKLIF
jgi:CubicO group peptidase (beta-lactamase class C family)